MTIWSHCAKALLPLPPPPSLSLSAPFGWVVCFPAAACDSVTPACLVCISDVSRYVYVTHFNHTPGFSFLLKTPRRLAALQASSAFVPRTMRVGGENGDAHAHAHAHGNATGGGRRHEARQSLLPGGPLCLCTDGAPGKACHLPSVTKQCRASDFHACIRAGWVQMFGHFGWPQEEALASVQNQGNPEACCLLACSGALPPRGVNTARR